MKKLLHTKALVEKSSVGVSQEGIIDAITGSSSVLDRMGDIIDQSGWDLKAFNTNPVILWGHNVREERMPIGKALKTWIEDKGKDSAKLMFKVLIDLQDNFAAEVYRKVKDGFINTVSVGFIPSEWEELDPDNWFGGLKYLKQELLELSFVPVPANPEALVPMKHFAEKDKRFTPFNLNKLYPPVQNKKDMAEILGMDEKAMDELDLAKRGKREDLPSLEKKVVAKPEIKKEEKDEISKFEFVEGDTKEQTLFKAKGLVAIIQKAGRVLSSKNEKKVRQALSLLDEVLSELDKEEVIDDKNNEKPKEQAAESKKVINYKDHGKSPETENWDGPGEISKASVDDLLIMCAWYDEEKADTKSSYKLAHHKAEGDHPSVWRGVAGAMASLLGAKGSFDIPEEDRKGVYNHLKKHYEEYSKDVPDFKMVEDQVLACLDEELLVLALDREEKYAVRLIKKLLDYQREEKEKEIKFNTQNDISNVQAIKALKVLNLALTQVSKQSEGGGKDTQ